jgi:hypothetical protein
MSARGAARLAWSLWAFSMAATIAALLLIAANWARPGDPIFDYWAENTIGALTFSTLGALIVSRRPGNAVGWIFCAGGLAGGLTHCCGDYAVRALLVTTGTLPAGAWAAWLAGVLLIINVGATGTVVFLLFPDGRLPSPRWRPVAWLAAASILMELADTLVPGTLSHPLAFAENPAGIGAAARLLRPIAPLGRMLLTVLVLLSLASLVVRFRRSRGDERQAVKWFAFVAVFAVAAFFVLPRLFEAAFGDGALSNVLDSVVVTLSIQVGFPLALTIGILKYRLYDIDRLINHAVVYATLTAFLAAAYLGAVMVLQQGFRAATGQGSNLAIVASTLAVAALFRPLRARVQGAIDRRFYRRQYDATRVVAEFGAQLRAETDLGVLQADLLTAVEEVLRPAHVSLWLQPMPGIRAAIREGGEA